MRDCLQFKRQWADLSTFQLHVLPMDFPHLPERLKKFRKAAFLDGVGKPVSFKCASVMEVQIPPAPWVVCFAFAVLPGYIRTHRRRRLKSIISADNAHHVGDGVPFSPSLSSQRTFPCSAASSTRFFHEIRMDELLECHMSCFRQGACNLPNIICAPSLLVQA